MRTRFVHLAPLRVYGTSTGGNCHKVRLAFARETDGAYSPARR